VSSTDTTALHRRALAAYRKAVGRLVARQQPRGALAGEVVWNSMLASQWVIARTIVGQPVPPARARRLLRALDRDRNPDGGFGMHPWSGSYLFHTTLAYIAMRRLGVADDAPEAVRARQFIADHGGPAALPTWGRAWLAMLGLYPWEGVQPLAPEVWLLPASSPAHPSRLYCHTRLIYLGLSYLAGTRYVAAPDALTAALERELYPGGYEPAAVARARDTLAATDVFEPPQAALRLVFDALRGLRRLTPDRTRRRALARAIDHIKFELRSTDGVCLSPVNGLLFAVCLHAHDPDDPDVATALEGVEYWVWEDDVRGLRIAGARSDVWDTAFVLQALAEGPPIDDARRVSLAACAWLPQAQLQATLVDGARHYRDDGYGGWGFADERHPWPVSDCTAEAVDGLLAARERGWHGGEAGALPVGRLRAAAEFVLARQNPDGGFGSYERRRGPLLLRHFNPSEMYGNCMVELSYTECTASCVRALAHVRAVLDAEPSRASEDTHGAGTSLRARCGQAIAAGVAALRRSQHACGGWAGFWGVNFTYGTWFAVEALLAAGVDRDDLALRRAAEFLARTQRSDGGWGEHHLGMLDGSPAPLPDDEPSRAVQTAWALLALQALDPEHHAIARGVTFLLARQRPDGEWPAEPWSGVFFQTALLDYELYRMTFPTWALARWLGPAAVAAPQV